MTFSLITVLSIISWTVVAVRALTIEENNDEHKAAFVILLFLNFVIHAAFQAGAAWQYWFVNDGYILTPIQVLP